MGWTLERQREYNREYYQKNKEKVKAQIRARLDRRGEHIKVIQDAAWKKARLAKLAAIRLEGIAAYGGKCACCGESEPRFLTLEHINGRANDKNGIKCGAWGWPKLKKLGWPKDDYTVLCFNCNLAKDIYGVCPHQGGYDAGGN